MVNIRNNQELDSMRESGRITACALKRVLENIKIGITALELDKIAEEEIQSRGGGASFKTVEGYPYTTCVTFNNQVVHGLPTSRKIMEGDIVSVDLGTVFKGWHTDSAWSLVVGKANNQAGKFLSAGEEALWLGIKQAKEGSRIGDIASAIQQKVEGSGYSVVRSLVGHGVGQELHEDPEVPGYGKAGIGLELKSGMTLAIEVIYALSKPEVFLEDDGWTVSTLDGSLSGLFEMTVIVGKERSEVITNWRGSPIL